MRITPQSILAAATGLSAGALAMPAGSTAAAAAAAASDPAYTVPTSTMRAAITCPDGIKGAAGGVILAVHGTGSTGEESWGAGPYRKILPKLQPTWDFCWVDLPDRSMIDLQTSAEYVAYAIHYLAGKSKTGKVSLVTHSQGGPDTQWALDWFPSTRPLVKAAVYNSPDLHGTANFPAAFGQITSNPVTNTSAYSESIFQQLITSHMSRLSTGPTGNTARVPTFSIYSVEDEVVQPVPYTSTISGAQVTSIQKYCPLYVADHFLMIIAQPAVALTYAAFKDGAFPSALAFNPARCVSYPDGSVFDFTSTVPFATAVLDDILTVAAAYRAPGEPLFRQYVCDAGAAPASSCGTGYFPTFS